jgi:hypothetical protein
MVAYTKPSKLLDDMYYDNERRIKGSPASIIKILEKEFGMNLDLNPVEKSYFVNLFQAGLDITSNLDFTVFEGPDIYDVYEDVSHVGSCMSRNEGNPLSFYAENPDRFKVLTILDKEKRVAMRCIMYNGTKDHRDIVDWMLHHSKGEEYALSSLDFVKRWIKENPGREGWVIGRIYCNDPKIHPRRAIEALFKKGQDIKANYYGSQKGFKILGVTKSDEPFRDIITNANETEVPVTLGMIVHNSQLSVPYLDNFFNVINYNDPYRRSLRKSDKRSMVILQTNTYSNLTNGTFRYMERNFAYNRADWTDGRPFFTDCKYCPQDNVWLHPFDPDFEEYYPEGLDEDDYVEPEFFEEEEEEDY